MKMQRVHTHYDNLKVARDAPPEVIRAAYKTLTQRHHPDRNPGNADAARIMQLINCSYEVLSDPAKRRAHDLWIAQQENENPETRRHADQPGSRSAADATVTRTTGLRFLANAIRAAQILLQLFAFRITGHVRKHWGSYLVLSLLGLRIYGVLTQKPSPPPPRQVALPNDPRGIASTPTGQSVAHAVTTSAHYADLFDRMRAGFKLGNPSEQRAVDEQLRWYTANLDYLQRTFSRADKYLYYIVSELERRGMPLELALLPAVESGFDPYAYSSAAASGLWQFIPGTASKYGLKQDWWYDGRRDIVESTSAALDYLQLLHDEFGGDWLIAVAAYNCDEALVERAMDMNRAVGRPVDFWDLPVPCDTYVPKLLAMKRLVLDPKSYGVSFSPIPNQPYFARVSTHGQVNLRIAAEIAGISPDELYELNPAFHRWATDPAGPHFMLLPVTAADTFEENITQLSADQRLGVAHYAVHRGDSLATVALKFHTSVIVLREINDRPVGSIAVGDDLRVPGAMTDLPAKVVLTAARVDGRGRSGRTHVQVVRPQDDARR